MESLGHLPLVLESGSSFDLLPFQISSLESMCMGFRIGPGFVVMHKFRLFWLQVLENSYTGLSKREIYWFTHVKSQLVDICFRQGLIQKIQ